MAEMSEQFYRQVSDSIKLVFDLTSRIDERVKLLVEQHNESSDRIEKLVERQESTATRLSVLENKNGSLYLKEDFNDLRKDYRLLESKFGLQENKLIALEQSNNSQEKRWSLIIDIFFKILVTISGAVLLWKFGIKD